MLGDWASRPVPRAYVVRHSVTNLLRLSIANELREAARDQPIGDIVRPTGNVADAINAVSDQVVSDEFNDFHFSIL
jgi:hypothetical protein